MCVYIQVATSELGRTQEALDDLRRAQVLAAGLSKDAGVMRVCVCMCARARVFVCACVRVCVCV